MVITAEMIRTIREKTGAGMTDCKKALVENSGDFDGAVDWLRKKGLAAAASKSSRVAADGLVGVASFGDVSAAILEVNSETDFVAKNSKFQEFVSSVARIGAELGAQDSRPTLEQLLAMNFGNQSIQSNLTDLISVIGENLVVRRLQNLSVSNGVVATYAHSTVAPGLGKIGVLVAIESSGEKAALSDFGKKIAMHIAASNPRYLNISDVPSEIIAHERSILLEQVEGSDRPAAVLDKMIEGRLRKFYEDVVLNEQAYIIDSKKNIATAVGDLSKELNTSVKISGFVRFALGDGIQKAEVNFADEVMSIAKK
jgi:elongation factor Ts